MFLNVKARLNVCPSACEHHSRIIRDLLGESLPRKTCASAKSSRIWGLCGRAKLMSYFSAEAQRLGTYE